MTFMPPRLPGALRRGAPATKIPQRRREQRLHAKLVHSGLGRLGQPRGELLLQRGHLLEADDGWCLRDERADAGAAGRDAAQLQLAVCLHHRVRVHRQRAGHVLDPRQLVTRTQEAEPQRIVDLVHQLQVGRHPQPPVQVERDRRHLVIEVVWFIGNHG
jgi:hypothetical protein